MWKVLGNLTKSSYWNYRILKSTPDNVADEDAFEVRIVEVYYENNEPHSYCEAHLSGIDDLNFNFSPDESKIKRALALEFLKTQGKMAEAFDKPILYEEDFHN